MSRSRRRVLGAVVAIVGVIFLVVALFGGDPVAILMASAVLAIGVVAILVFRPKVGSK